MKSALTIVASDPSGGAGIFADLKAFSYLGIHGTSVICAVTAQNTQTVSAIHEVPLDIIEAQLNLILSDINISSCKTGMLYSPKVVELIAKRSEDFDFPLVVDPVLSASSGHSLAESGLLDTLKKSLIPKAQLVTPNIPEAEAISDTKITTVEDMKSACGIIHEYGCKYVLITGGHLDESRATDVLYDGKEFRLYLSSYHPKDIHGTGCTHSALICGHLALGKSIEEAVGEAKFYMDNLISNSYPIGGGSEILGPVGSPSFSEEECEVIMELPDVLPVTLIPEVGINMGYALKDAKIPDDVCALEGRFVRVGDRMGHMGALKFGASKHIARIILTAMKFDSEKRCAMNIKYSQEIVNLCSSLNLTIGSFSRENEPKDSSSMEWGTKSAIEKLGYVPDIIYDKGGIAKEPMIRILGNDPLEVQKKLISIIEGHNSEKN
jgi:hydroxymethylpyrimidine/phosphomethylpyrimidine kinase